MYLVLYGSGRLLSASVRSGVLIDRTRPDDHQMRNATAQAPHGPSPPFNKFKYKQLTDPEKTHRHTHTRDVGARTYSCRTRRRCTGVATRHGTRQPRRHRDPGTAQLRRHDRRREAVPARVGCCCCACWYRVVVLMSSDGCDLCVGCIASSS